MFSSCITLKYYDAEILLPAEVDFTHQTNTAAVILSEKMRGMDTVDMQLTPDQRITLQAVQAFQSVIAESPKYVLQDYPDNLKPWDLNHITDEKVILDKTPEVIFESEGVAIDTIIARQEGKIIYYTIYTHAFWNIHDLSKNRVYPIGYKDSVQVESSASTGIPDKEKDDLYDFIGQRSGQNMAQFFCPSWEEVGRMYFSSPHYFKNADQLVEAGRFLEAAAIWRPMVKHSSKRIAARACYNMAFAAEMNGNPELGIMWLEQAGEKGLDNYATYYGEILKSRVNINRQLDKQMGVVRN